MLDIENALLSVANHDGVKINWGQTTSSARDPHTRTDVHSNYKKNICALPFNKVYLLNLALQASHHPSSKHGQSASTVNYGQLFNVLGDASEKSTSPRVTTPFVGTFSSIVCV